MESWSELQIASGKFQKVKQVDSHKVTRQGRGDPLTIHFSCTVLGFLMFSRLFPDSTPGHSVKHSHPAFRKDGIVYRGRARARA